MKKFTFSVLICVLTVFLFVGAGCVNKNNKPVVNNNPIVGGDRDVHGCIGSAGYSWCEIKQKCLRPWEEKCEQEKSNISVSNLKFSTGKCDSGIDPYLSPQEGILDKTWKNQNTLIIEGYVKTFCGGATITGDYIIEGSDLILKYKIKTESAVTSCKCLHKVIYEILNLENKDYSISIISE